MTYPRLWLIRPLRRALMIGLMALFGLLTPAVLLYSAGYRYDKNTGRIKVTGVISIEAEPADATLTINNIRLDKRLPVELTNRAPGRYQLRLDKPGYKSWEKEITVESQQTTYVKEIRLLRDQLPVPVEWALPETSSWRFLIAPDGRYALASVIESGIETITLFDTENLKSQVISRRATNEPTLLDWSPDSGMLLLAARQKTGWRLTLLSLADPNQTADYRWMQNRPPRWQWLPASGSIMFAPDNRTIIGLSQAGAETITALATDTLWFVTGEREVWSLDRLRPSLPETIRLTAITDLNRERIIGRTENTLVVIKRTDDDEPIETIAAPQVRYNPATKEWLAWSDFELWTIYENGGIRLLNRAGERVHDIQPLDKTGVLLVVSDRGLTAFNPGYAVSHDLFIGRVDSAGVNQRQRLIYFLGEVGGRRGVFQLGY